MGLRKILTDEESALHKVCKPVTSFDKKLHKLLDDMVETLIDSGGVGLAAPQVGILRRVVLVDVGMEEPDIIELINPEMLETDGEQYGPRAASVCPASTVWSAVPTMPKSVHRTAMATGMNMRAKN